MRYLFILFFNISGFAQLMNPVFYQYGSNKGILDAALKTSLVAYYKMENNANDATALSPNGTVTSATFVTGKIGLATTFPTPSARIDIADTDNLSFTRGSNDVPFSMSFWVNYSSFSGTVLSEIINKRANSSSTDEWQIFRLLSDGRIYISKFDKANNAIYQTISMSGVNSLNTWYHIVITDDGTKTVSGMKMYLNGVVQTTSNASSGAYTGMNNSASITRIGLAAWDISTGHHLGLIDELGIWKNRELSASDVTELYNYGRGTTYQ